MSSISPIIPPELTRALRVHESHTTQFPSALEYKPCVRRESRLSAPPACDYRVTVPPQAIKQTGKQIMCQLPVRQNALVPIG
jgi:hypothetical protein